MTDLLFLFKFVKDVLAPMKHLENLQESPLNALPRIVQSSIVLNRAACIKESRHRHIRVTIHKLESSAFPHEQFRHGAETGVVGRCPFI